ARLRKEPQLVLPNGSAERSRDVPDPPDGVDAVQAASADRVRQIVALQVVIRVVRKQVALEDVAAVLGYEVQLHATQLALGTSATQLDVDFVGVGRIDVEPAPGALGGVVTHAVLQEPLLALGPTVNHHSERLLPL